jgi:hypothetical protein
MAPLGLPNATPLDAIPLGVVESSVVLPEWLSELAVSDRPMHD